MLGRKIHHYRITRLIGEGGMAAVYEAEHDKLHTKVAIKVLNPILAANANIRQRFENEARFMASLEHPNITRVIDYDEQQDMLAIVMELLKGQDLNAFIKKHGPLSPDKATNIFSQILDAFQYAHRLGIVHRDIKPSNIFVNPNNQVKILDFGIAKMIGSGNDFTQTGAQMGTPVYMSPEQVTTDKTIDHRSDIYSLGVTLFFALNGKPPYDTSTQSNFEIYNKIVYEPIPNLDKYPAFDRVIAKAVKKNRNERFQSAEEFKSALLEAHHQSTSQPQEQTLEKTIVDTGDGTSAMSGAADVTTIEQEPKKPYKPKSTKNAKKQQKDEPNQETAELTNDTSTNSGRFQRKSLLMAGFVALVVLALYFIIAPSPFNPFKPGPLPVDPKLNDSIIDTIRLIPPELLFNNQQTSINQNVNQNEPDPIGRLNQLLSDDSVKRIKERYLGEHLLGAYFVGYDEHFGKATILEKNGIFTLQGKHEKNGNYVKLNGTISIISMKKFEFTGTIEAYNKGESNPYCKWNGKTVFQINPYGSGLYWRTSKHDCFSHTGDIDIFFKKASS